MKIFVRILFAALFVLGVFSAGIATEAQTSISGVVQGTITDKAGAVVPNATVELVNTATNETKATTTNATGEYTLPNVPPGTYTLKISKGGFATVTFANIKVDVTKSYNYNATLEVSSGKEVIEVSAQAQAELQTSDAVVGNVVGENELMRLSRAPDAPADVHAI
jgi:sarcosine oxidase gamma subunit